MTRDLCQPHEIIVLMYFMKENEIIFILGTNMDMVDREVKDKQKEMF